MRLFISTAWLLALACVVSTGAIGNSTANAGQAEQLLAQAQQQQKFTFLLFYKTNDAATHQVARTLQEGIARRGNQAAIAHVWLSDPQEQAIIARFGVGRSPMPLTMAVAPNGAITGVFSQKLADSSLDEALVTPAMANCIKAMQNGKLVVLCAHPPASTAMPNAVREFQADPHFNQRLAVVSLQTSDPAEAKFVRKLEIAPNNAGATVVFMAPPGVMVGTYNAAVTKAQMAADLHKAGRCCDDPHCPHNH